MNASYTKIFKILNTDRLDDVSILLGEVHRRSPVGSKSFGQVNTQLKRLIRDKLSNAFTQETSDDYN